MPGDVMNEWQEVHFYIKIVNTMNRSGWKDLVVVPGDKVCVCVCVCEIFPHTFNSVGRGGNADSNSGSDQTKHPGVLPN